MGDMKKDDVTKELLTAATNIESVQQASEGEISISEPETSVVAEAATKAPEIVTDMPTFDVIDDAAGSPAPSAAPSPSEGVDSTNSTDKGDQLMVSQATM